MPNTDPVDPSQVGPGLIYPLVFLVLLAATIVILRSLTRRLKKLDTQAAPATSSSEKSPAVQR